MARQKITDESGVFTVTLEHNKVVQRGHTYRFYAKFVHVKDGVVNLTTPVLKFFDATEVQAGTTQTPNQTDLSTGEYKVDYLIPATWLTGVYALEWSGTYSSTTILIRHRFIVKSGRV